MRTTSETLSQVTDLMAIVSAPPVETATIRHIEVLLLQPQVLHGGRHHLDGRRDQADVHLRRPVDAGLAAWAGEYLNERLAGMGLGARMLHSRLHDESLPPRERAFLDGLAPAFTDLVATAEETLYVEGTARLFGEHRFQDLSQLNALMSMLERRVALLAVLREALGHSDVLVRIGAENTAPALRSLTLVASGYGLPGRPLGTVSVIGPVRMDYAGAIGAVQDASRQLSRFVEELYG